MEDRNGHNTLASDPMERFVGGFGEQIFNRDLLSARCANVQEDAVAECQVYEQKPLAVLRGSDFCSEFVPQDQEEN